MTKYKHAAPTSATKPYKCKAFNWLIKAKHEKLLFLCLNIDITFEIILNFRSQQSIIAIIVFDDTSIFKQSYSAADIQCMRQVMRRYNDGRIVLFSIFLNQILHRYLRCGIKKIKWLIKNQQLGMMEHCPYNSNFLLITH